MTVPTIANPISYTGDNTTAVYAYSWRLFSDADIVVTYTTPLGVTSTLTLNTDYTVDGVLSYTGGNVTLLAGNLATGYVLEFTRDPAAVQDTDLQNEGQYNAKVVENALDLLTMIDQSLQQQVDDVTIQLPTPSALDLLQWKADETGLQNLPIADLSPILLSGNFIVDRYVGGVDYTAGVTTSLTLSQAPGTVNNVEVLFDGVSQQDVTFSLAAAVITFDAAIPVGVARVQIKQAGVLSIAVPADNSVSHDALQAGIVSADKIVNNTITATQMAADAAVNNMTGNSLPASKLITSSFQSAHNAIIGGSAEVGTGTDYTASASGTFDYGKCPLCKGALVGSAVSGTLTQNTTSSVGRTGYSFKWSAVTTTGSGLVKWRFFVEAADAAQFISQHASVSCSVRHSSASSVGFVINIYKADVANVFSAVTLISSSASQSALTNVNKALSFENVAMGACGNGIMVEVVGTIGAVTTKIFELADMQMIMGATAVDVNYQSYAQQLAMITWYFEVLGGAATTGAFAAGQATLTTAAVFFLAYARKRTVPTITDTFAGSAVVTTADGTTQALAGSGNYSRIGYSSAEVAFTGMAAGLVAGNATLLLAGAATDLIKIDARF